MTEKNNKKQIEEENKRLFEPFKKEYDKQNSSAPFSNTNLFSTIHLSENDHTNILWDIIRYRKNGDYIFLKSFIKDCLGLDVTMTFDEKAKATQYKALSNIKKEKNNTKKGDKDKSVGYIDLLLKDNENAIIIENKVCDADDGKNQLARYYYTFAAHDDNELKSLCINTTPNTQSPPLKDNNIYVVYLTKDDSKIFPAADTNSLPECLQNRLGLKEENGESIYHEDGSIPEDFSIPKDSHYIHISYSENILPWLKEKVLPEISAYNSDEFYRSVCLYVDYLENDVLGQTQQSRDIYLTGGYNGIVDNEIVENEIVENENITWKQLYKLLLEKSKQKNNKATDEDEDDKYLNPYINFLRAQVTRKVNEAIKTDGWKSYCTPSFVLFYKTEWYNPSSKYNIPPLNLLINPNKLIKLTESENVCFQIEHYQPDMQDWKDSLIDILGGKDKFNMDNNRGNTPRLKEDGGKITVNKDEQIEIQFDSSIENAINSCGFLLYAK